VRSSCSPFPRTRSTPPCTPRVRSINDLAGQWPSLAAHVAELAPGAKVAKAFNAFFASIFENAAQLNPPANLVFCGDDEDAKKQSPG
jgi:predicted dinucleotide-binding enzyme